MLPAGDLTARTSLSSGEFPCRLADGVWLVCLFIVSNLAAAPERIGWPGRAALFLRRIRAAPWGLQCDKKRTTAQFRHRPRGLICCSRQLAPLGICPEKHKRGRQRKLPAPSSRDSSEHSRASSGCGRTTPRSQGTLGAGKRRTQGARIAKLFVRPRTCYCTVRCVLTAAALFFRSLLVRPRSWRRWFSRYPEGCRGPLSRSC